MAESVVEVDTILAGDVPEEWDPKNLMVVTQAELDDLTRYIHAMSSIEGTGEYALGRLLLPGGWARRVLTMKTTQEEIPSYVQHDSAQD